MADIAITALGGRQFRVDVRQGSQRTSHQVIVPERLPGGPDLDAPDLDAGHLERAVRESFDFLLAREPATSILRQFSLSDITRYFPEFPAELARRLA